MRSVARLALPLVLVLAGALFLLPTAASAAPAAGDYVDVFVEPDALIIRPLVEHSQIIVTLRASDGCVVTRTFERSGQVVMPLVDDEGKVLRDGNVGWEVILDPELSRDVQAALAQARKVGDSKFAIQLKDEGILPWFPQVESGGVLISKGVAIDPTSGNEDRVGGTQDASRNVLTEPAVGFLEEEQTISGDLTVYNSLCVGFDCLANESYGSDTIRLKENNLRIHFNDTSVAASFPTTDWRIEANSSSNGGGSYLSFVDASAGRRVFSVEANAPSNALYVDDGGRVGVGTSIPVMELHVINGDSPGLRLEQDGSSGFGPQTWDVVGNETNFFVRDATNGSSLPFRIRPGASSSAIFIDVDNDIGFGTASPDASLHVLTNQSSNFGGLRVENSGTGNIQTQFASTDGVGWEWRQTFRSGDLIFDSQEDGANELELDINGELTVVSLVETSDRAMKENFQPINRREVLSKIVDLPITRWNYINQGAEIEHLGPMAQDFYGAFGVGPDDKHIPTRDAASVALVGVQALYELQQESLGALQAENQELKAANAELLKRLEALEAKLAE
ncbi:MAG: tail fiber domain-containing protein [Acidobacteriota bacterium]